MRRTTALGALGALASASVRWGSSSLGAIAGAQAVLGPAGWTGNGAAVASSWLAATALVVAPSSSNAVACAPFAVAAATVVAGPGAGGALTVRVVASVVAFALAVGMTRVSRVHYVAPVLGAFALAFAGFA